MELKTSYFCSLHKQFNTAIEHKILIGRLEKIHFPKLSLYNLDAKIDTGAYTSSLHCHHITTKESTEATLVRFFVLDPDHPVYENRPFEIPVHKIKNVKSSNGIVEERVIIKQKIEIAGKSYTIDLSLTNRAEMKYPVLLGRRFLNKKFIVDVSKKYVFKQTQ